MANCKFLLALTALLGIQLSATAQPVDWDIATYGADPLDGDNDHFAFMAVQQDIQAYYDGGGQGPGTLILHAGEYIIGNQQFWGYPNDPPTPTPRISFGTLSAILGV